MQEHRVDIGKSAPKVSQAIDALDGLISDYVSATGMASGFVHLLRLRASQINQCAYCVRLHTRDALACGESPDRISLVAAWRESHYFSDKERASLALIEAVTLLSDGQIPDPVYAEAERWLTKEEIAAVEWTGVMINIWNRIAVASRMQVRP
jgi:AhpD family alkylhydroperoxidase